MRVNHLARHRRKINYLLVAVLFLSAFFFVSWVNGRRYSEKLPSGEDTSTQAQNLYKSLDLSQAEGAIYVNQALTRVRDLGIRDKVKQYIVSFKVPRDGLTEYGLMTLPNKPAPAGGYPVIILCHGYFNPYLYSTTRDYLADMEFYSQHSFAVIKPDYRGQGLSRSAGKPEGAFYSMAYNSDVMSLIAAIKQTNYLNKQNINLWGHSMGAYVALRASVLSQDVKKVILLSAPVGTVRDRFSQYIASSDVDNPTAMAIKNYEVNKHGTPFSNPGFWERTSPMNYLQDTNASYQIHVGALDKLVPPYFSDQLNSKLKNLKKPHGYYVYRTGGHGLVPQRQLIWQRSLKFLQSN